MVSEDKIRKVFPQTAILKDQSLVATFKSAAIPSFLRDWIIKKKADINGKINDTDDLRSYIEKIIPKNDMLLTLQDEARTQGTTRKFLAQIDIQFDSSSDEYTFEIAELGFTHKETLIESYIWDRIKDDLLQTGGGWGLVRLGYLPPDDDRKKGKFTLLEFKNFCPYTVNLNVFKQARAEFTIEEWIDVLLGAIDYNPDGYEDNTSKLTMLTRLLPFLEPRLNLIELAPKGTGKSYLFRTNVKYGWLVSGSVISRPMLFYDISKKKMGLIATKDFVALDEINKMTFSNTGELQGAMQAYLEAGEITVDNKRITSQCGLILMGNIPQDDQDPAKNMIRSLPKMFHESALLDRFHGFIRGNLIPRMNESLKINGWALNSEYFTEIMHLFRSQSECLLYRSIVDELVYVPKQADTRDTEAILRICTGFLKLLFPHITDPAKMDVMEFKRYCLRPAVDMRSIVRKQMQILDPAEFGNKNVAAYRINPKYDQNKQETQCQPQPQINQEE